MPERDPTCIGKIRHVLGATITVALDPELAGVAPIYRGRLQPVGQIGSLVRIPQGLVDLIATVSLVGIAELSAALEPTGIVQSGERWLQVQLLGEIDRGTGRFQRGVASYPGLDDPVHFATSDQLKSVFPHPDEKHVRLGRLAAAEEVPVSLEASRFVVRHAAVVGSTGSGKTSAVSALLQNFVKGGWRAANIVVVDPHGEYARALAGTASVRSVLGEGNARLRVPYWALAATDIARIFAGAPGGATFSNRFAELVTKARRKFHLIFDQFGISSMRRIALPAQTKAIRQRYAKWSQATRLTFVQRNSSHTAQVANRLIRAPCTVLMERPRTYFALAFSTRSCVFFRNLSAIRTAVIRSFRLCRNGLVVISPFLCLISVVFLQGLLIWPSVLY
jgi:hypothetical protein